MRSVGCRYRFPATVFYLYQRCFFITFRTKKTNKTKKQTNIFFCSFSGFWLVFKLASFFRIIRFFSYFDSYFVRIFSDIADLELFSFFEESSWIEFSVTHGLLILFFWLMKVVFDISIENWEIFPHFSKTKKNVAEISDISGALKWRLREIRVYILRKGCSKILYQNYFHTLNQKKFPNISHRRSL